LLSRFSVKRPYIITVAVIIILILGGVSLSKMKTNLLPSMDIPYLAVITTDAGASAEKVESEVTDVLEGSLSKISGVSSVQSQSADNYSMIFLQFQDGTDMDSAMVKASSAVNEVSSQLPSTAGSPNYMEISMDMMATLYVAASYDDHDIYDTSKLVSDKVTSTLERVDGVADVSTVGSAEQSVEVRLSDSKIEDINNKLLASVNSQLYDAKKQIDEGEAQLAEAEEQLTEQQSALEAQQNETANQLGQATSALTLAVSGKTTEAASLQAQVAALKATDPQGTNATVQAQIAQLQQQAQTATTELTQYQSQLSQAESGSVSAAAQFGGASAQLAAAKQTIESSKSQLSDARTQYEESREKAISSANISSLVTKETLSSLITAQNFSMPAGYIDSGSDDQWLLRVGDNLTSVSDLRSLLLADIDGVGEIRLGDVAEITTVDNVGDQYMRINGADGVLLSIFKTSTASTSDVSNDVKAQLQKIEAANPGLHLDVISDQGSYIALYINSILQSLILGALLAVVVLIIFLRDWRPTLIMAFSIPFSVLCALVLMYFSGIDLNIMSLGGVSIAIGMLVDNSIIVLENIYRLRSRGISAARAAVQGAKQITGAVIASTLTTICVFLPIVFTTGMVNQLMMPFALTIAYVLTASMLIALTMVPAASSFMFKNYMPRRNNWFEALQTKYAHSLGFFLRHKAVPLVVSVALLVVAIVGVANMGITMIPSMSSKTVNVTVNMPEGTSKDTAFATADKVMEKAQAIEGVSLVGGMDGTATVSMISSGFSSAAQSDTMHETFSFYLQTDSSVTTDGQVQSILDQLAESTKGLNCEVITDASSSEAMSSMMGSGFSLTIKGPSQSKLVEISEQVMDVVGQVQGYTEIENGMEDASTELHLVIDRDKLTKAGYTVAQLYSDLSKKVSTSQSSATLSIDDTNMSVSVVDETNPITADNLLDTEIEITNQQTSETSTYKLSDFATVEKDVAANTINHIDSSPSIKVTAEVEDGYNNALLSRELQQKLDNISLPDGYTITTSGELENINTMLQQMLLLLILGFVLIYLVMVAQFQSLLSPFIIILTVPLAFTGGLFGLLAAGEQLSMMSLLGFAVLMGTVVNNGIVFVDYVNQLRRGGLGKRDALVAAGRTRMRPILMTAITTIFAMLPMVFSQAVGSSMERGMAVVVVGGLLYATFMTLYVVPVMYDILYRRVPTEVDLGDESIDDDPGDAEAYLQALRGAHALIDTPSNGAAGAAGAR
jgi:multidrug efflux pump subunit AcrB